MKLLQNHLPVTQTPEEWLPQTTRRPNLIQTTHTIRAAVQQSQTHSWQLGCKLKKKLELVERLLVV
jgi:hypothetical protein